MQASELAFLHGCTLAGGAKNYQLWNHRRRVALQLGALDVSEVLQFLSGTAHLKDSCRQPSTSCLLLP
jgi:hypothetical protein